jgi:Flp pilus assembly CpaE family ATPase
MREQLDSNQMVSVTRMDNNSKPFVVLLVEDDPDCAALTEHWLSGTDAKSPFKLNWTDSLAAAIARLEKGPVDVILLDLHLSDSKGIETFKVMNAYAKGIPIIVLSSADSEALALQAIRLGAEDYLIKAQCTSEALKRAVLYAIVRRKSGHKRPAGRKSPDGANVLGVVGAKGGVGATTVACSLALQLRESTGHTVLLLDLDSGSGLVNFLLSVECKHSVPDALKHLEHLDCLGWDSMVFKHPTGLHVLATDQANTEEIREPDLQQLIRFLQPLYDWIVLDAGRLGQSSAGPLAMANEVLLVTTSGVHGLYQAKRASDFLADKGIDAERLRLIVNKSLTTEKIAEKDLNKLFGLPVDCLATDRDSLHENCLDPKIPDTGAFHNGIALLTRKIMGTEEPEPKRYRRPFLSFFEIPKRRKVI